MDDRSSASNRTAFGFTNETGTTTNWTTGDIPIEMALYMDIQHSSMSVAYRDSVANGVQYIGFTPTDMLAGTRDSTTEGDFNGDGFNERQGAYMLQAFNSSVHMRIRAQNDTCRFYPAFHISNYFGATKPAYVNLYSADTDTATLVEGFGYNIYHDQGASELVIQLDTVLCDTTWLYIAADEALAVTLSDFYGKGGANKDTLFWRTESEQENLGFLLYRRVNPAFFDSLANHIDSAGVDTMTNTAGRLFKRGSISAQDTAEWVQVNDALIPAAAGGTSVGPRDYRYIDYNLYNEILYEYRLVAVSMDNLRSEYGPVTVKPGIAMPARFMLHPAFPNPFRRNVNIRFDLPVKARVSLAVYTLQGRLVRELVSPDKPLAAGYHKVIWNSRERYGEMSAAGPYIYRIVTGGEGKRYVRARMMLLVR
jgi:hypothetical protein